MGARDNFEVPPNRAAKEIHRCAKVDLLKRRSMAGFAQSRPCTQRPRRARARGASKPLRNHSASTGTAAACGPILALDNKPSHARIHSAARTNGVKEVPSRLSFSLVRNRPQTISGSPKDYCCSFRKREANPCYLKTHHRCRYIAPVTTDMMRVEVAARQ